MGAVAEVAGGEVPQHMQALKNANRVRLARAKLKRAIKRGELGVADVLADVPPDVANMPVMELLMAPNRWGRERSRRALRTAGGIGDGFDSIPEQKPVGELTERQRRALTQLV